MYEEDNAVILRGFVCLMCHLKHFYANKDIKLSFGKVANCFMIFSPLNTGKKEKNYKPSKKLSKITSFSLVKILKNL